jgi:hypothetical protein
MGSLTTTKLRIASAPWLRGRSLSQSTNMSRTNELGSAASRASQICTKRTRSAEAAST